MPTGDGLPTITHDFLPTLATGLTDQNQQRIEETLDRTMSANTQAMDASDCRSFEDWTRASRVSPLPAPPELLATFNSLTKSLT